MDKINVLLFKIPYAINRKRKRIITHLQKTETQKS